MANSYFVRFYPNPITIKGVTINHGEFLYGNKDYFTTNLGFIEIGVRPKAPIYNLSDGPMPFDFNEPALHNREEVSSLQPFLVRYEEVTNLPEIPVVSVNPEKVEPIVEKVEVAPVKRELTPEQTQLVQELNSKQNRDWMSVTAEQAKEWLNRLGISTGDIPENKWDLIKLLKKNLKELA
jgi:hypothetical protein